jgi:hypothetical protein
MCLEFQQKKNNLVQYNLLMFGEGNVEQQPPLLCCMYGWWYPWVGPNLIGCNQFLCICNVYEALLLWLVCFLMTNYVATLALGSRPRQKGVARVRAQGKPKSRIKDSREWRRVWGREPSHSQGNSHFGRWSPGGLPKLQRKIWGVKSQWFMALFISLESSWSVDV